MQTIGPYQLLEELGRGAMGVVFRGFDPAIGRPVAIKIIQAGQFASAVEQAELKLRFAREAAAAGKLSHPNIVTIYQLGDDGDTQYLVLELVNGCSLEKTLSDRKPQDPKMAVSIIAQVADALDYAHGEGIVHRDVKPANLMVRPDGRIKITDFGIARIVSQTVTKTGSFIGTVAYMSPEQIMSAKVDGKADQFSLGVIAYQMLGGGMPFTGDTIPALMHQIMNVAPWPLHAVNSAVSPRTSEVIGKALAKNPDNRFASCTEFAGKLEESFGPDTDATATMHVARNQRPPLVWIAAGLAVLGLLGVAWHWWPRADAPPNQTVADANTPAGIPKPAVESLPNAPPAPESKTNPAVPKERKTDAAPPEGGDIFDRAAQAVPKERKTEPARPPEKSESTRSPSPEKKTPAPVAAAPPVLRAGTTKLNANDGLTYVWIPPGTFQMGCSPGDSECYDFEKPAHEVTISKGFWIGQTEVTQEAWQRVTGTDPSHFKGPKLPVESVTWDDALSYCRDANMRLPTEAEWEYAARAGSTGSRYGEINQIAWYSSNGGSQTHEVGRKQANGWGLHDMLGNVWEWVEDWFAGQYPPGAATDPRGPSSGTLRVLRGGSWVYGSRAARASGRVGDGPANRDFTFGVRCAGN